MKKYGTAIRLVLLTAWIAFIFSRSMQPAEQSSMESQWVLELLQSLLPFELSSHFIRKLAHFTEFAILGVFSERFWGNVTKLNLVSGLLSALLTCIVTALCDETIQLFVEGRAGMIQDVWIDVAGAVSGVLATLAGVALWRKRMRAKGKRQALRNR